jgi:hypothetical protein
MQHLLYIHCIFSALQFTTAHKAKRIAQKRDDDFAGGNAEEERGAERSSTEAHKGKSATLKGQATAHRL